MKLSYTKREIVYLFIAFFILGCGVIYAWRIGRTGGIPAVGSIIIILGITFAARDFHELLAAGILRLAPLRRELEFRSHIKDIEEAQKRVLSEDEVCALQADFNAIFDLGVVDDTRATKRRHRFVEAYIVILGTAVNGFGQLVLDSLLK